MLIEHPSIIVRMDGIVHRAGSEENKLPNQELAVKVFLKIISVAPEFSST